MLPSVHFRILAVTIALLLLPATASAGQHAGGPEAASPPTIVMPLEPVGASGVRRCATIAPAPGEAGHVVIELVAEGLQPGAAHPVHLHAGTLARPSAGFGLVGELTSDAVGQARLEATDMAVSTVGERMGLALDLLADGDHFLEIHAPGMAVVAVAAIPAAPSNTRAAPVGPTGLASVDVVVEAVLTGDVDRLAGHVRMRELPCGPDMPEGFALAPPRGPGEVAGTPAAIFPSAACEVYWPRETPYRSCVTSCGRPGRSMRSCGLLPTGP